MATQKRFTLIYICIKRKVFFSIFLSSAFTSFAYSFQRSTNGNSTCFHFDEIGIREQKHCETPVAFKSIQQQYCFFFICTKTINQIDVQQSKQ